MATNPTRLGRQIRTLRKKNGLTQSALAENLGVSASYLNLIEHEKRPLPAALLLRVAEIFRIDLRDFAPREDAALQSDLGEVFGDPLFESDSVSKADVRELVESQPEIARSVLKLYQSYAAARESARTLADHVLEGQDLSEVDREPGESRALRDLSPVDRSRLSSEQVSDLLQKHHNYFPSLEEAAERVWQDAGLEGEDLFAGLAHYLGSRHRVRVEVRKVGEMNGAIRRFRQERKELLLSEVLRRGSRNFQLAHQLGLLECPDVIEDIAQDPILTSEESRALCRIALANYFAAAVLMPYDEFLHAAREERYDLDLLGHRFRASVEQICHRLTTLAKDRNLGIDFHFVRIDLAGNISKRFSGSGIHFPRFSGLCPLWNVHAAFLQPGRIRVQVSRLSGGNPFFSVARTIRKHRGGYHSPNVLYAIGLGCDIESARQMVYADGVDFSHLETAVPVGITCRLCDRMDCQARAFPSLHRPLRVDENVRGVSFYTPVDAD